MKYIFLIYPLLLFSCIGEVTREQMLSDAVGRAGKIQILADQNIWDGPIGQTITSYFDAYAEGVYLRPEPTFEYYHIPPGKFSGNLRRTRNVIQIRIRNDSTYKETSVLQYTDLYARGQLLIQFADSDPNRLLKTISQEMSAVVDKFNEVENERLIRDYGRNHNELINEVAKKKFGVSIHLPRIAELKVNKDSLMWIKHDRSQTQRAGPNNPYEAGTYWIQQGIVIWETPYSDTAQLTKMGIRMNRDTVLKYNVPGKVTGSYMGIEYDSLFMPKARVTKFKEAYAIKAQGIWKHLGEPSAFGGGPFVQLSVHNEKRGSIINVLGYIYAPKFDKREYLRELKAMLGTLSFE